MLEEPGRRPEDPRAVAAVLDVLACVYGTAASLPALSALPERTRGPGEPLVDALADSQRRAERLAGGLLLDRLPFALFAVDAGSTLVYGNEAAGALLADGHRLRLGEAGRLEAAQVDEADTLRAAIDALESAAPGSPARTCHLTSAGDGRPFGVLAFRAPGFVPPIIVLLAADPGREQALRALLRSIFGLTRAEAELCLLLLQGLSLDEAARERRITASTARAAWQSVTWKAGGAPPGLLLQILHAALVLPLESVERVPGR